MKNKHILWLLPFWVGTLVAHPLIETDADGAPTLYVQTSQASANVDETFTLSFYLSDSSDLYGVQIDIMTDITEGSLLASPAQGTDPFTLDERCLFDQDYVFANETDPSTHVTSLLVTRHLQETAGYSFSRPRLLASISLIASVNLDDIPNHIKVSDDLLAMQMGQTNMTMKLSSSSGGKIAYSVGLGDTIKPVITIPESTLSIPANSTFIPAEHFSVSDNLTPIEYLHLEIYFYANINEIGEYICTIFVQDEFYNYELALFTVAVGDPYQDITIIWGTNV